MKSFCRKTYNSQYYVKNRERILHRREMRKHAQMAAPQAKTPSNQLSLFEFPDVSLKRSNILQRLKFEFVLKVGLVLLVLTNTYFLLCEAVEFYRSNHASTASSVMAAIIVELLLLAFSAIQTSNRALKIATKVALTLLFLYSSWSFCSHVVGKACGSMEQLQIIEKRIARLEAQVSERAFLIGQNLRLHRITVAKQLADEKDKLIEELSRVESERSMRVAVAPKAQMLDAISMVALRLLLQFSNIIAIHHVSALFKKSGRHLIRDRGSGQVIKLFKKP